MPIFDFFKRLFGIQDNSIHSNESSQFNNDNYRNNFWRNDPDSEKDQFNDVWRHEKSEDFGDSYGFGGNDLFKFHIFTDPLELHRYFEQQMAETFRSFRNFFSQGQDRMQEFPDFFQPDGGQGFGGFFYDHKPIEPLEPPANNLRQRLLKPGFENSKTDTDLDGKINPEDLDLFLREGKNDTVVPYQGEPQHPTDPASTIQLRTFGRSVSEKIIRGPDGMLERHRVTRDNAGNEETVIIRQLKDKQYTLTIRTDKNGKQERFEDVTQIDPRSGSF